MKKDKDEELDDLFRKGMEDPVNEAAFREADWDDMEQILDKPKKHPGIVYWLSFIGSAAALVLLFLGWWFLRPEIVKNGQQQATAVHLKPSRVTIGGTSKKENTGKSGGPVRLPVDASIQKILSPVDYVKNTSIGHRQIGKSFLPLSAGGGRRDTAGYSPKDMPGRSGTLSLAAGNSGITNVAAVMSGKVSADDLLSKYVISQGNDAEAADLEVKTKSTSKTKFGRGPQLALGVIASSDLNGVNSSFQQSKIGGNFGAIISVGLSKKWTLSTGASYDIKPYLTNFDNYHTRFQFKTTPASVSANCRMLEIPVDVNYQVYNKRANKITVGTGLSSYFMLREDYTFNYTDPYAYGPSTYSVVNKNRNILSIINLDATFEHQVNSKMGITIQPYLKVPLENVGASQVRLQTTGVAVGLSWNLNSSSKR